MNASVNETGRNRLRLTRRAVPLATMVDRAGDYEGASVIRRTDRVMMLSWTMTSGVTCCAGRKMKSAAPAGNTGRTHPGPARSDSGN